MILNHAEWLLFAWVLGNQIGVPVPAVPALLGAGALAGSGHLSLTVIIAIAVGASLGADLTWYGAGRWRGTRALEMLSRMSPSTGTLVHRARCILAAQVWTLQVGVRFVPELNAIAAGLAGASKLSLIRFVCYGAVSALTWAAGWIGLGYFLSHPVTETTARLGVRLIIPFLVPFALYLPFRRARRYHVVRLLGQGRTAYAFLRKGSPLGSRTADASSQQAGVLFKVPSCAEAEHKRPGWLPTEATHTNVPTLTHPSVSR